MNIKVCGITEMKQLQQLDGLRSRGWVPVEDQNSNFGGSTLNTYLQAGLGFSMPDGRTSHFEERVIARNCDSRRASRRLRR